MTFGQWFIFFLIVQLVHFLGTWKLYKKAGRQPWEAAVPVYNGIILMKIINRPWWWVVLLFIPVVNLIMFPVVWVETLRSFGLNSTKDTALGVLTLGFYIYYVNYMMDVQHIPNRDLKPRTAAGEWTSSILFAVVAATIVHTYFMQPYTIPTPSLEKTLLVGDFLFVSKFHYGARVPMTPVSFPMVHDTIPVVKTKSYRTWPQIPYFRLPGFQEVKKNDIVVFNWPVDTVRFFRDRSGIHVDKPIDKKSNYVKRCVATPGDSLQIIDGKIHINGTPLKLSDRAKPQTAYTVTTKGKAFDPYFLYQRYDITDSYGQFRDAAPNEFYFPSISDEAYAKFKNHPEIASITKFINPVQPGDKGVFPNNGKRTWTIDNFGPLYIPKAGTTVNLDSNSYSLYRRIIEIYEGSEMGIDNRLTTNGTQVLLNGSPISSYTFKQDYYWMMGDNRHNSEDARAWGFVPYNHIVGKPVFIWMSWDSNAKGIMNKIRWERLFTTVGGSGKPTSYLSVFLIIVVLWFAWSFFKKRRQNA